ncbi:MAG: hypothetical protein FWG14_07765 [Peptococcaceae bacterium]|nr:hypothetical protein [Peptococcaceae bacterium]
MNTYNQGNIEQGAVKQEQGKDKLELIVVIMLGITALLTAWAVWVGSVHGSNQSQNYTEGNILSGIGNAEYNRGIQMLMTDMLMYNEFNNMVTDLAYAKKIGDSAEAAKLEWKIQREIDDLTNTANETTTDEEMHKVYQELILALSQAAEEGKPLDMADLVQIEGYMDLYLKPATEIWEEAKHLVDQGNSDNANANRFGLVAVFTAMTLFMLGIISSLKRSSNKRVAFGIAIGTFLIATIYMMSQSFPDNLLSFFGG